MALLSAADAPRPAAFHILLITLVTVFASIVGAPDSEAGRSLTSAILSASLIAALWVTSRSPLLLAAGFVLIAASAVGWFGKTLGLPSQVDPVGPVLSAAYFLAAALVLSPRVFRPRIVTEDSLLGTICIYLLLALAFACAYLFVHQLDPGAFTSRSAGGKELADFTYLSLVTMTTLGYGDISPVSGIARALATLQATAGVLYAAIAVSQLVAVHAVGGEPPAQESARPWHRRRLRNLFIALSVLALLPVALDRHAEGALRQLLSGALLLAALYGLGAGKLTRIAAGAVLVSLVLRAWPGPAASAPKIVAMTIEVCIFGAGIAVVARRAIFRDEVSREVLFGASALYVLLGIWVAAAFALISAVEPGSLSPAGPHTSGELLYLSFMTITTTGYGDIVPTIRTTELLSGMAACLGIFYPAILVARLVSLSIRREGA